MDTSREIFESLLREGYDFFVGLPSYQNPSIWHYAQRNGRYLAATNEMNATAIAQGYALTGKKGCVVISSLGIYYALSSKTSMPEELPITYLITDGGSKLHNKLTKELLTFHNIKLFSIDQIQGAEEFKKETNQSIAFWVDVTEEEKKSISKEKDPFSTLKLHSALNTISLEHALEGVMQGIDSETAVICGVGSSAFHIHQAHDREGNLYQRGIFGLAAPLALGVAKGSGRRVVAIEGDGGFLSNISGSIDRGGEYTYVLIDNGEYNLTGGHSLPVNTVDYPSLAGSLGFEKIFTLTDQNAIRNAMESSGKTFIHIPVTKGAAPSLSPLISPVENIRRFKNFLNG